MVRHPRGHRWSGFLAHADGRTDRLAGDHPVYRRAIAYDKIETRFMRRLRFET
jgi:hypothetical protein